MLLLIAWVILLLQFLSLTGIVLIIILYTILHLFIERPGEEERGLQKADQGEEEQRQEGVGCWPQNCQTQSQEERRLNSFLSTIIIWEAFECVVLLSAQHYCRFTCFYHFLLPL